MTRAATQEERWDRERDYRKTLDALPPAVDAHTVALLSRAHTTDFDEAVSIIEGYAKIVANEAVIKALHEAHARTMEILGAPADA